MSEEESKDVTLNDVVVTLQRNQEILEDIATWLKILGIEKVRGLLEKLLDKPEKILVYHFSTESRSTREIKDLSRVSLFSISSYQTSWFRLGLMKKIPVRGKDRYVKNFNLEDYGIEIPVMAPKEEYQQEALPTEQPISSDTAIVRGEDQ